MFAVFIVATSVGSFSRGIAFPFVNSLGSRVQGHVIKVILIDCWSIIRSNS